MKADNIKPSDAKLQSIGLKFTFVDEKDKLNIQVFCQKQNQTYTGQIEEHPLIDFELIKQSLQEGDFKTLVKNEDILKVRIGGISLQLIGKKKTQMDKVNQKIYKLTQKQTETQQIIKQQQVQIINLKGLLNVLQREVKSLQPCPESQAKKAQKYTQEDVVNLVSKITDRYKNDSQRIRSQTSDKIEQIRKQLDQSKTILNKYQNELKLIQNKLTQTLNIANNSDSINEKINKTQQIVEKLIDDLRKQVQKNTKLNDQFTKKFQQMAKVQTGVNFIINSMDKLSAQSKKKQQIINKLKEQSSKMVQTSQQVIPSIQSFKWSKSLKSKYIGSNDKKAFMDRDQCQHQFCLFQVGFSKYVRKRQVWAIRFPQARQDNQDAWLGICLKKSMLKNNFNDKNMYWSDRDHGFYLINLKGQYWSHSSQGDREMRKNISFREYDTINIEYDPIEWRLKFRKNKIQRIFQMSIVPPPQDDEYHPCVGGRNNGYSSDPFAQIYLPQYDQ